MKVSISNFLILIATQISIAQIQQDQHLIFTNILAEYVQDGFANYTKLKNDKNLDRYLEQLTNANPEGYGISNDQLAFWLNVYNAFTLKIIIDEYPIESINDLHWGGLYLGTILGTTVWDEEVIEIYGSNYSLNNIEHDIIRKRFSEERIHFALVCASIGCPLLRVEAYEGYKLDEQLMEQTYLFFNDTTKNYFDLNSRTAYLSKIIDWYDEDFGETDEEILLYISQFTNEDITADIKTNPHLWKIEYLNYNWNLNDIKSP